MLDAQHQGSNEAVSAVRQNEAVILAPVPRRGRPGLLILEFKLAAVSTLDLRRKQLVSDRSMTNDIMYRNVPFSPHDPPEPRNPPTQKHLQPQPDQLR